MGDSSQEEEAAESEQQLRERGGKIERGITTILKLKAIAPNI